MSLVEQLHSERKARLVRLGAMPAQSPLVPRETFDNEIRELQARVERQQVIISDLNAIVSKQRELIRKFADEHELPTPRINDVIMVVAAHYKITKQILIGEQRAYNIAFPRQIAYYFCRELGYAWTQIGRAFGRDHTSVYYGSTKIGDQLKVDQDLAKKIEILRDEIDKYVISRVETTKAFLA